MTDNDRNTRTLVVCFVLALAVLVPLRVMEGGSVVVERQAEVLGETEVEDGDRMELIYGDEIDKDNGVVLPDAEIPVVIETEE